MSWTAREEAAQAAAVILARTALRRPDHTRRRRRDRVRDIAAIASELTGRMIEHAVIDPDEWIAAQVAVGQKEFMARFMLGMYQAAHDGYFAGVDPLLGTLPGLEPQSVRDVLAQPTAT